MTATAHTRELTLREAALTRWCARCGGPATALGEHRPDGSFDPYSVMVSDAEIDRATSSAFTRTPGGSCYERRRTRESIALGKHVGSYGALEPYEARQVERQVYRHRARAVAEMAFAR